MSKRKFVRAAWKCLLAILLPVAAIAHGETPPAASAPTDANATPAKPAAIPARASSRPGPEYPFAEQAAGHGGTSRIRFVVGADGHASQVTIAQGSGFPVLDRAALEAVKRWTFSPAEVATSLGGSTVEVPIAFVPPPDDVRDAMANGSTATCGRFLADVQHREGAGKPAVETPLFTVEWSLQLPAMMFDVNHLGSSGNDTAAVARARRGVFEEVRRECGEHPDSGFVLALLSALAAAH